jgi:hypothetical protein
LFRFRVPRSPPRFVSRGLRLRSRKVGGCLPGRGQCLAGDPIAGLLSRGREWDLPGSQAIHPVPLPRSGTPAEPPIPRLFDGLGDAVPAPSTARASACPEFRGYRAASAPAAYASRMVLPSPMQSSLPAGRLAFTGRESNPLDRDERFQITFSSPSPGLFLAQRRLQPLRYLHDCSGRSRLERLPGGTYSHWRAPPSTAHTHKCRQ